MSIRDKLLARMNQSLPPLEAARKFLGIYFCDIDGIQEAYDQIRQMSQRNTRSVIEGIKGIEALLNEPLEENVLSNLVAWEANYALDDQSDAGARAWLEDVVKNTKQILEEVEAKKQ